MNWFDIGKCYTKCNEEYKAIDTNRIYCKKGCDADEDSLKECWEAKCSEVCIREELGEDG